MGETKSIAHVSRGKDSTAMLEAIRILGYPLDGIVVTEIWFDDETPAQYPDIVKFNDYWDSKVEQMYGIPVTKICAPYTYKDLFMCRRKKDGVSYGFPLQSRPWCKLLKYGNWSNQVLDYLFGKDRTEYIGYAADEIERSKKNPDKVFPLIDIGWKEATCKDVARKLGLLSPTYDNFERDGCWFCNSQSLKQLRYLYTMHRDLWEKLMELDSMDCGSIQWQKNHKLADYEKRFKLENAGVVPRDRRFRWKMIEG